MSTKQKDWITFAALSLLIAGMVGFCFAPGIGTGYLFDDFTSVVPLQALRSDGENFWYYVFSDASGPLGRPVSIATFALEQVLFSADSDLSQAISIGFHAVNVGLVLLLARHLCNGMPMRRAWLMAALVALLWGCAPQKVSSVLYIVQRMTILSAFFVITALVTYLVARTTDVPRLRIFCLAICIASLMIAPFAKETGVLGIFYLAALELFLVPRGLQTPFDRGLRRSAAAVLAVGAMAFVAVGMLEFLRSDLTYALRNFSFADRLLSTPVVLLDHARQFFVPETARLGLLHDDFPLVLSGELSFRFWSSTLVLLAGLAYIVFCALRGRRSLAAFAVLFYLIGHGIESTFLPLEIYFEHRNYLPSLGLSLLPLATMRFLAHANLPRARSLMVGLFSVLVVSLAFSTVNVSNAWQSNESLVKRHLQGHPRSARAFTEAALYRAAAGDFEGAQSYLDRAYGLSLEEPAARSMGVGDVGLTRAVIACLARRPVAKALPDVAEEQLQDPFRGAAPRSLLRMYEDGACPDESRQEVSDWIYSLVTRAAALGSIRWTALADLAALEKQIGSPVRVYFYAAMASSQAPYEGTPLLMMIDAAVALGDRESLLEGVTRLETLESAGKLGRAERLFLERFDLEMVPAGQ